MNNNLSNCTVRTRFAPSPTGLLHSGNYRTAIFSYLFAKHNKGSFILRIEDTDRIRSKKEYMDAILDSLSWLGISWDKYTKQSDNKQRHYDLLKKLIEAGHAYISSETITAKDTRSEVVRFRNPGGIVSFTDIVRGKISVDVTDLGNFVIAKSIDEPLFHFAVVVDDADAGITHIIRGEDHISNTPRQILIQRALNFPTPKYAHLPLILAPDRSKLSKRKGAKALTEYRDIGILPEAMFNYITLLGWNPGNDKEIFTQSELIELFSLERVQKSGAQFDETKLFSINQYWMRQLNDKEYISRGKLITPNLNIDRLTRAVPLLQERAHTFSDAAKLIKGEFSFLFNNDIITTNPKILTEKETNKEEISGYGTRIYLTELLKQIETFSEIQSPKTIRDVLMEYADREGRAAVLWPLRYALSGISRSPDPFTIISIIGKQEALKRIKSALVKVAINKKMKPLK